MANKLGLCTSARTILWDDERVQLLISISVRFPELSIIPAVLKSFWPLNSKKNFYIAMAISHFKMEYGGKRKLLVLISDNLKHAKLYFGL